MELCFKSIIVLIALLIHENLSASLNSTIPETERIDDTENSQITHKHPKIPLFERLENFNDVPRCGFRDDHFESNKLLHGFFTQPKWTKFHITWHFDHKNGRFTYDTPKIRRVLSQACNLWSEVSVLTFEEVSGRKSADIIISFERSYHPEIDSDYMGGPTLAHAFSPGPGIGGDIHFREDFNWNFDVTNEERPPRGQENFFGVALHEIGHSIGLNHISNSRALMYPLYTSPARLSTHDIKAIQSLYGVPKKTHERTTTEISIKENPKIPEIPSKCDTSYDAVARISGELFIFKGQYMFRPQYKSDALEIRSTWQELPENFMKIDSVYQYDGGEVGFFIGRDIFVFYGLKFVGKFSLLSHGINHHYKKIDAIFNWPHSNAAYIFSGDIYWKMTWSKVDLGYPKRVRDVWKGVENFDTAFNDGGKIYFVSGNDFYEFNTETLTLDQSNPRSSAQHFMQCPSKTETDVEIFDIEDFSVAERRTSFANSQFHHMLPSIILTSLAVSQVLSSISLYF